MKDLSKYSGLKPVNLGESTPVSFEEMQKFNDFMKQVNRDYKVKQLKLLKVQRKLL